MYPQIDPPIESPAVEPSAPQGRFVVNLGLMIAVGVFVSWWLLRYTELFAKFLELLGLGGALGLLGFINNIVPDDRQKALRLWKDRLFYSARTSAVLWKLLLALPVAGCFVGSVELKTFESPHTVSIGRTRGEAGELSALVPGAPRREWFLMLGCTDVFVNLKDYPQLTQRVCPWRVKPVQVPDNFLRPVVLVYPGPLLMALLPGNGYSVKVEIDGKPWTDENGKPVGSIPFDGYSVWIGCERHVAIPQHINDALQVRMNDLHDAEKQTANQRWKSPKYGVGASLPEDGSIVVKLFLDNLDTGKHTEPVKLSKPATISDFGLLRELEGS
jgi:hypothetical protein